MMYLITEKYMNKRYRAGRTEARDEWLAWLERGLLLKWTLG